RIRRSNSDVVPVDSDAFREFRSCNIGPTFNGFVPCVFRLPEIRGQTIVALLFGKISRREQPCDLSRESKWRISTVLLPPVLLCDRAVSDKVSCRALYHRPRVEPGKSINTFQLVRDKYWKSRFIHLHSSPIGRPVEPPVPQPVTDPLLRRHWVDERRS